MAVANSRLFQEYVEILAHGNPNARLFNEYVEILNQGNPNARLSQEYLEVLTFAGSASRLFGEYIESVTVASAPLSGDAANTIAFSQVASTAHGFAASASNTITFSQLPHTAQGYDKAVAQTLTPVQTAIAGHRHDEVVPQTLTITSHLATTKPEVASNTIVFTDIATTINTHKVADNFLPFQSVTFEADISKTVSQNLALVQVAIGAASHPVNNLLSMAQIASGITSRPAYNHLIMDQGATYNRTFGKTLSQPLLLNQSISVKKTVNTPITQALGLTQIATCSKVLAVSVAQNFILFSELVQQAFLEDVANVLVLNQNIGLTHELPRSVLDLFGVTQSVSVAITYRRLVAQTLVFKNSFNKNIGVGTPGNNPGGGISVPIPPAQGVVVKDVVILRTDTNVITLPPPEFNDTLAGTSKLNIKRAMDGARYIYKRTSVTSKLSYEFIIDRLKAIELRSFILANNSKIIGMENWKGELWAVLLINNPFTTVEEARWVSGIKPIDDRGNKCRITLEFEGSQTN